MFEKKSLSLVEQKKIQWAKEREEMVGLCGLWGRPRTEFEKVLKISECAETINKINLLPPISSKESNKLIKDYYKPEEESETSGYLSDSPEHPRGRKTEQYWCSGKEKELYNNGDAVLEVHPNYWNESKKPENVGAEKKMYKNYQNATWAHRNNDSSAQNSIKYSNIRNNWYGTPESMSSDDGCRLRWGDRGVGIGHLWEPVSPDSRLPQASDSNRPTPRWVEKGLKSYEGTKADILIINHPDETESPDFLTQRNFILGQNAPIPLEVIEEREKKRKKALEHQNAIKKQLEERELKRKLEKENRIKEEKLEEERIKKAQEIERMRFEEEQKKIKEKQETERKKEEAMREAIELAERKAKEEKRRYKRNLKEDTFKNAMNTGKENLENPLEHTKVSILKKSQNNKISKKLEGVENTSSEKEGNNKTLKDSSSQFEESQLSNSFQLLNMNELPVNKSIAAVLLDTQRKENFLLPQEGVQLALLMSPNSVGATTQATDESLPRSPNSTARVLTPSKYRVSHRSRFSPRNKSTQTDFKQASPWINYRNSAGKKRKISMITKTDSSAGSQKSNSLDRRHKHSRSLIFSKYSPTLKSSLSDRPKWGINRPLVQYKTQSEKDPYYKMKVKEKLKAASDSFDGKDKLNISNEEEKELNSVAQMIDCRSEEDEKTEEDIREEVLGNGFRMNSNLSSPLFVPIDNRVKSDDNENDSLKVGAENFSKEVIEENKFMEENEYPSEEENTVVPGSIGYLTQSQLAALQQITNLREGLKRLQMDYPSSRSITPLSEKI